MYYAFMYMCNLYAYNAQYMLYTIYIYYNCIAFLLCECNDLFVFNIITNLRVPCHTQECSMVMTSLGSCSFWLCYVVMGIQHMLELSLTKMWCDTQLES